MSGTWATPSTLSGRPRPVVAGTTKRCATGPSRSRQPGSGIVVGRIVGMVTTLISPPCREDAERAAEAVAVDGVSAVLLFGSVARGEAGLDSDIDLVAIHDDLDYSTRFERSSELAQLATEAAGHRAFVYVTDWPEWEYRSTEVSTSLESAIADGAVTLYHREPAGVRWGKEIGMPTTNRGEAAARLDNSRRALFGLTNHLTMSMSEKNALEDRDPGYYLLAITDRMCALCAGAQMAIETSLKALIHLGGSRPARTHDLDKLLASLTHTARDRLRNLFVKVTPEEASKWREAGTYEYADWSLDLLVNHAYHMARTAIAVTRYVADQVSDTDAARLIHKAAVTAEATLDRWDLSAGDPFDRLDVAPLPKPAE